MTKHLYSYINLDFTRHPHTADIVKAVNTEAIKKSFRNLVLTNYYEVPHDPELGSNLRGSLFENFSPLNTEFLKTKIRELADREPRIRILSITINQQEDYNSIQVSINYEIIELNREDNLTVFVGRTR